METNGVWVVYFFDHYPIIVSIWDSEIDARRASGEDQFYYVAFVKFGTKEVYRELNK